MRAALLLVVACAAPATPTPQIDGVSPDHGPLVGGTRITITGRALGADDGSSTRVFVGGREAPLAFAVDSATLEVVIPPGEMAGPSELLVVGTHGSASTDRFRYSTPPAITAVVPEVVVYKQPTTVVVTGSGFVDEGAGESTVLVDGVPSEQVVVVSDRELHVHVPAERALGAVRLEVANTRGVGAKDRAFRYRPSTRSGLLLFPRFGGLFAIFYDPVSGERVDIPVLAGSRFMSTVVVDDRGEYWAYEGNRIGRLDLAAQRLEQTVTASFRLPAMARVGDTYYAIDRQQLRFGTVTFDGTFTPIADAQVPCCGSYGLAFDGTTLWMSHRSPIGFERVISPIDPATGVLGTAVAIAGSPHVEELRWFAGALYATTRDGRLVTIDPTTGAVTLVTHLPRASAMEVFE